MRTGTGLAIIGSAIALALFGLCRPLCAQPAPTTPIDHVVVIFQENISFDHYFASYPNAANPPGEPPFTAAPHTPSVNGLTGALLTSNPNAATLVNPFRFDRSHAATCDQDHDYTDEQEGYNGGLLDKFVLLSHAAGMDGTTVCQPSDEMGYFDGNTVTAMWNYAQSFAMSDNSYSTGFGPSGRALST